MSLPKAVSSFQARIVLIPKWSSAWLQDKGKCWQMWKEGEKGLAALSYNRATYCYWSASYQTLVIRQGLSSGGERHRPQVPVWGTLQSVAEREGVNMFHVLFLLCQRAENTPLEGTATHALPDSSLCWMHHIWSPTLSLRNTLSKWWVSMSHVEREKLILLQAEMCVEVRSIGLKIRTRTFPASPLLLPICRNLDKELSFSLSPNDLYSGAYATYLVVCY